MTGSYNDPDGVFRGTTGDPIPSTWQNLANDNMNLWRDRPACRLTRSTDMATATSTWTAITFDTELYDTAGMHSTSSNTTRITIPSGWGGRYSFGGNVQFHQSTNAGTRRGITIRENGTSSLDLVQEYQLTDQSSSAPFRIAVASQARLAAGAYIELMTWQESTGTLNVEVNNSFSPIFWASWEAP